ncbi:uncharacterized protein At5g23160 [Lotus japonicus]|uniref:uncharacterized protein At5g23160 n=1 Tax=Lotus japonicus TaxID=34305 RepID=UPI00258E95A9|nr:uncharacterized protein At5g23160 [Lotus japonicus]
MANTKSKTKTTTTSTQYSKPKTSIFLCCFGSHMPKNIEESDPIIPERKRTSRFSWPRIRLKNNMMKSTSKTVPLEASFSEKAQPYPQTRSKSTLNHKSPPPTPPPPVVLSVTPYNSPTQTRHGASNNIVEDTREQGTSTSTPTRAKRQARRLSSSMQNQTTIKKSKTAGSSYDALVAMSVLGVTLVIMIFWGRLCAILCTSAWLYFIPRFRNTTTVNDVVHDTRSNDVDLDSEVYKKKVIMEGLLGRNHRG